jgi:hypothetical protein
MPLQTHPAIIDMAYEACDLVWAEKRRRPKEPEVRAQLRLLMAARTVDPRNKESSTFGRAFPMPKLRKLQQVIKAWSEPKVGLEEPWSITGNHGLDPSATGALVQVWTYVNTSPYHPPLTVALASWVSRIRFIPEAGGSLTGEVIDPRALFRWACRFSAREKASIKANETDTRVNVVLAKLTMSAIQFATATRGRALDADGIEFEEELLTYYPREGEAAHKEAGLFSAEGRPDISKYAEVADEMLSRYPEAIHEAWQQVIRIALENEEYVALRDDEEHPGIGQYMALALLNDICQAYDSGASLASFEEYEPLQRIQMVIREALADYATGTIPIE